MLKNDLLLTINKVWACEVESVSDAKVNATLNRNSFLHTKWLASFFSANPLVTIKMPKGYNISLQSCFSWYFFLLERISHIQNVTWTEQTLQIIIPLHIIIRIELKLFSSNKLNKNPQQILSRRTVHVRKGCLPTRNKNSMKKQRKSYFKHV